MISLISAAISAVAGLIKLATVWLGQQRDKLLISLGATQERAKINEASAATQEAIKEVADERASISDPAIYPDDLARELRRQSDGPLSGRKRPF